MKFSLSSEVRSTWRVIACCSFSKIKTCLSHQSRSSYCDLFQFRSVCLSVCLSVYLSVCLSVCLSACLYSLYSSGNLCPQYDIIIFNVKRCNNWEDRMSCIKKKPFTGRCSWFLWLRVQGKRYLYPF